MNKDKQGKNSRKKEKRTEKGKLQPGLGFFSFVIFGPVLFWDSPPRNCSSPQLDLPMLARVTAPLLMISVVVSVGHLVEGKGLGGGGMLHTSSPSLVYSSFPTNTAATCHACLGDTLPHEALCAGCPGGGGERGRGSRSYCVSPDGKEARCTFRGNCGEGEIKIVHQEHCPWVVNGPPRGSMQRVDLCYRSAGVWQTCHGFLRIGEHDFHRSNPPNRDKAQQGAHNWFEGIVRRRYTDDIEMWGVPGIRYSDHNGGAPITQQNAGWRIKHNLMEDQRKIGMHCKGAATAFIPNENPVGPSRPMPIALEEGAKEHEEPTHGVPSSSPSTPRATGKGLGKLSFNPLGRWSTCYDYVGYLCQQLKLAPTLACTDRDDFTMLQCAPPTPMPPVVDSYTLHRAAVTVAGVRGKAGRGLPCDLPPAGVRGAAGSLRKIKAGDTVELAVNPLEHVTLCPILGNLRQEVPAIETMKNNQRRSPRQSSASMWCVTPSLPPGLTLDRRTGVISGRLHQSGTLTTTKMGSDEKNNPALQSDAAAGRLFIIRAANAPEAGEAGCTLFTTHNREYNKGGAGTFTLVLKEVSRPM